MNPFDLRGPEFLLFYLVFGGIVIGALRFAVRMPQGASATNVRLTDPYMIAYLRGGRDEAITVAAASLIDRKLLKFESVGGSILKQGSNQLVAGDPNFIQVVRRPIERKILERFIEPADSTVLFSSSELAGEADVY
jgi:uncharacterized protein (TIGR04222 family)